jgi:hypothetical protein
MSRHFVRRFLFFTTISCCLAAVWAQEPPPVQPQQELLVLRNGEVLAGRITRDNDYYRIVLPDGELRVKANEAELVCRNLDEAYTFKCKQLALGRADDHLDLADWCLRQSLPGYAAKEIAAAMALDPRNPRCEFLDRRLRQMLETPSAPSGKVFEAPPVTNEDLDRLVRGMPPGTVESFTSTIQPLLMNSCATSSCHGPASKSSYVLLRIPTDRSGSRRLTQRNLQSTVTMLDYQNPQQSRLLTAASRAHGTAVSAIFDPQTVKYRQLYLWIASVTQRVPGSPDVSEPPATVGINNQSAGNLNQSTESMTAAERDPEAQTVRPSYRNRVAKQSGSHADSELIRRYKAANAQSNVDPSAAALGSPSDTGNSSDDSSVNRPSNDPPPGEAKK